MSASHLHATDADKEKDGGGTVTPSKESVSQLLKGIFSIKSDRDKEKGKGEKSTTLTTPGDSPGTSHASSSPLPAGTPSPTWPSADGDTTRRQEKSLVTGLPAAAPGGKGESARTTTTTKAKFMDFFKTDAEKRQEKEKEKEREKEEQQARSKRAHQAVVQQAVKLELKSTSTEAGRRPITGEAIRAEGFVLRVNGVLDPFTLVGSQGVCRWFRASADGFDQITEGAVALYVPTLDDVDCRVCCQWVMEGTPQESTSDAAPVSGQQSSFAELGPIQLDPTLEQASIDLFQGGKAVFTVREQETDELCQITVKRTMIRILPADGGAVKCSFTLLSKPASAGGATSSVSPMRLCLDPADPLRFSLEDTNVKRVFRGSMVIDTDHVEQYARARRERDAMTCLVRRIIRTGSEALTSTVQANKFGASAAAAASEPLADASPLPELVRITVTPALPSDGDDMIRLSLAPTVAIGIAPSPDTTVDPSPAWLTTTRLSLQPLVTSGSPSSSPLPSYAHASAFATPSSLPSPSPSQILVLTKRISELTAEKVSDAWLGMK
jgi:hypothetical protein